MNVHINLIYHTLNRPSKVTQFKKRDFRVITITELDKPYPINHQK